jgi:sarcosine oxidase
VTETGGVLLAHLDSPGRRIVESYVEAMQSADIPFEQLTTDELTYRFPQFQPGSDVMALYQPQTGIADPAKGTATHIALARANGASARAACPVTTILPHPDGSGAVVETAQGRFSCRRLVVTAGAWTASLLESVGMHLPLTVTQEQVTYFATPHLKEFAIGRFPVFQWKDEFSCYGFPIYGEVATKAAIDASGPAVTPQNRSFEPDPEREQRLETFLAARIPGFVGPKLYSKTCLYTLPPDRDFILDQLPEAPQVTVFVGAGHAYKFASLLGQILSDLAVDGRTPHDITPFRLNRPAITDPQFVPDLSI